MFRTILLIQPHHSYSIQTYLQSHWATHTYKQLYRLTHTHSYTQQPSTSTITIPFIERIRKHWKISVMISLCQILHSLRRSNFTILVNPRFLPLNYWYIFDTIGKGFFFFFSFESHSLLTPCPPWRRESPRAFRKFDLACSNSEWFYCPKKICAQYFLYMCYLYSGAGFLFCNLVYFLIRGLFTLQCLCFGSLISFYDCHIPISIQLGTGQNLPGT